MANSVARSTRRPPLVAAWADRTSARAGAPRRRFALPQPNLRAYDGLISVTLRPDVVVRVRHGTTAATLVLDAKLKFDGNRLDALDDSDEMDWNRKVTRNNLHKMHTHRDAPREAAGAFVLSKWHKAHVCCRRRRAPNVISGYTESAVCVPPPAPNQTIDQHVQGVIW